MSSVDLGRWKLVMSLSMTWKRYPGWMKMFVRPFQPSGGMPPPHARAQPSRVRQEVVPTATTGRFSRFAFAMAAAAAGVKSRGGRLIGVTTVFMHEFEPPYDGCDELIYCQSMSERKEKLKDMGDTIVAVPGGIGTLDELFGALTERLLRRHDKPIALFDPCGFWDGIVSELHKMYGSGFVAERTFGLFRVCRTPAEVLSYFEEESQAE